MCKRIVILIAYLTLVSYYARAQYTLTVEINGIRNNTGNIMFQLLGENEKVIYQKIGFIKDKTSTFSIENMKAGKYAIRYYHDENLNGKMDKNLVGKPTEGYGFSNNVTEKYGPPPFEQWLFEIKENKKARLKITY